MDNNYTMLEEDVGPEDTDLNVALLEMKVESLSKYKSNYEMICSQLSTLNAHVGRSLATQQADRDTLTEALRVSEENNLHLTTVLQERDAELAQMTTCVEKEEKRGRKVHVQLSTLQKAYEEESNMWQERSVQTKRERRRMQKELQTVTIKLETTSAELEGTSKELGATSLALETTSTELEAVQNAWFQEKQRTEFHVTKKSTSKQPEDKKIQAYERSRIRHKKEIHDLRQALHKATELHNAQGFEHDARFTKTQQQCVELEAHVVQLTLALQRARTTAVQTTSVHGRLADKASELKNENIEKNKVLCDDKERFRVDRIEKRVEESNKHVHALHLQMMMQEKVSCRTREEMSDLGQEMSGIQDEFQNIASLINRLHVI